MNLKIFTDNIEGTALNQVYTLLKQPPFKDCKVRIMPDVHAGAGCVIGFTGDLGDKVIPNIVGVDIGCGMLTCNLGQIDLDLNRLDDIIHKVVPSGFNIHNKERDFPKIRQLRCIDELKNLSRIYCSIGTLGGGNHFIEVDVDKDSNKYLIVHSGSRNLGKQVADIYQKKAIELHTGEGIPKDLCYLTGQYREDYLHDMEICQQFASFNRYEITNSIVTSLFGTDIAYLHLPMFETIHNYISFEDNIVRKGAISAKKDEKLLIPMNMRDGCILGIGKGNEDWNYSAPHGAGRLMSRSKAKEAISLDDFEESMKGIHSTSVNRSTIDESPFAYKPSEEIIEKIGDTVEIIDILKPIYNFKATE